MSAGPGSDPRFARYDEVIEGLRGTCRSIHELEHDGEALEDDPAFCARLDDELRLCDQCGWWAETHEVNDDGVCADCEPSED